MYNTGTPPASELPSSRTLLRSTVIAAGVALLLLVTVVMPAEYGVDPTGIGQVLGLKQMGEIKQSLAAEAAADAAADAAGADSAGTTSAPAVAPMADARVAVAPATGAPPAGRRTDTISVVLQPGQGREIKLAMAEGARVDFQWSSAGGPVNYDMHADRTAAPAIKYHGYRKGQGVATDAGVLVAAFDGMHGWFWRNRTPAPVTVTLHAAGVHTAWKEVK